MTHPLFYFFKDFSSWEFFVPQISQIYTDFYGISGESLFLHRIMRSYRNILALRITHGFSRIFGRWPMAGARNVLLIFFVTQISQMAQIFLRGNFLVPQITQIFMESLVNRLVHLQGVSVSTEQVASAKIRE